MHITNQEYKTKSGMVYNKMREDILSGKIVPGDRLLVSSIAKNYRISEIPVREAFQRLSQEGLLTTRPHTGFIVSSVSEKDIENIFSVRVELESLATKQAAMKINSEEIEKLDKMIDEVERNFVEDDYIGYWKSNRVWHFTLYGFSGNDVVVRILNQLFDYSSRYPTYYTKQSEVEHSLSFHREIITALKNHDAEMAESLIKIHTIESKYHYIDRLKEVIDEKLNI